MDKENSWGGPRPGSGRPAPPGGPRKTRNFRANDIEWEEIKKRAEKAGMTASDFIRKKVLND